MKSFEELLNGQTIVPVVSIESQAQALGLAEALLEGGVSVIEITLRSDYALQAIKDVANAFPDMLLLAGTVTNVAQLVQVRDAGVDGVITPGITSSIIKQAQDDGLPILPGIASPSELMTGIEHGLSEFKLFPADVVGGIGMLKALASPFSQARFCPTGGLNESNYKDYLTLANVMCVGGSWVAPSNLIKAQEWQQISDKCRKALAQA